MNTSVRYMNVPIVTTKTVTSGTWSHIDLNTVILLTIHAVHVDRGSSIIHNSDGTETIPTSVQDRKEATPQNSKWH